MTRTQLAFTAAGLVAIVAAFFVGRSLRPGDEPTFAYASDLHAYQGTSPSTAVSTAGFSGVGPQGAFDGAILVAGRVISDAAGSLELEAASGLRSTVRVSDTTRVTTIASATRSSLVPGATVIARLDTNGAVEAVLVVATP